MNKDLKVKVITVISMLTIAGSLFTGCGSASTKSTNSNTNNKATTQANSKKGGDIKHQVDYSLSNSKSQLDKLVSAKSITASEESAILNLFKKEKITPANLKSQLNTLVTSKTITESQEATVLNTFKPVQASTAIKKDVANKGNVQKNMPNKDNKAKQ